MEHENDYTIDQIKREKAEVCEKISDIISDFEAKYGVIVIDMPYEVGAFKHSVDIIFKIN